MKGYKMKKTGLMGLLLVVGMMLSSCGQKQEVVQVSKDDPLVYLQVTAAKASSFDDTPDWAPMPDPMAPFDHDMLTRWSPKLGQDNEWIYADFGKQKVLSKLVIKWEQAYAAEYEILTSDDANTWKRLVLKTDGKGGVEELTFPAVKTRYFKLIGLKRVNPDWGISMWEIEPYGPKSLNPDEKPVAPAEAKVAEEQKDFQQELEKAKAPLKPLTKSEIQKGVCYTSWMYDELSGVASDKTLLYLKTIGVTCVAIVVPTYQKEVNSDTIYANDIVGGDTPSDASVEHAIQVCHMLGMKVLLKPHVDCRDGTPRIDIVASDAWFNNYETMIVRYAKLAAKNNVEEFAVGTELEGTTFSRWESRWRDIITKVKAEYKGLLIYCANWTEYKGVPFWDMMDFIGIDAYFPLTSKLDPTPAELQAAWEKIADEIQAWLGEKKLDKGVILSEVGYPSCEGAAKQPWTQATDIENQTAQQDCLEAVFSVMTKRAYYRGAYLWQVLPQDRWSPLGFTVKGKKAEKVVSAWYKK